MLQKIPRFHLWTSRGCALVGLGCFIVGVVGSAMDIVPGLEPTHWLIIAIGGFVAGCWHVLIGLAEPIKE